MNVIEWYIVHVLCITYVLWPMPQCTSTYSTVGHCDTLTRWYGDTVIWWHCDTMIQGHSDTVTKWHSDFLYHTITMFDEKISPKPPNHSPGYSPQLSPPTSLDSRSMLSSTECFSRPSRLRILFPDRSIFCRFTRVSRLAIPVNSLYFYNTADKC